MKTLLELGDNDCRFIEGDACQEGGALFCGEPQREKSSYCAKCHAIVWVPAQPRKHKPFIERRRAA